MSYARLLCSGLILCSLATAAAQEAAVQPQPAAIDGAVTRVYKSVGGSDLRLHIFNPPNRQPTSKTPAIVFFFGGGWTSGTVNQFVPQSRHLAQRGMIAVVADYQVFSRNKTSPFEAIADAKSAIRWLRAHADELGIDPTRLAAGGGSSGGHIALSAAVLDQFDEAGEDRAVSVKPNALVLFNPAVDTSAEAAERGDFNSRTILTARFGDRGREASPFHHLHPGLPPTLILHGKQDTTILYADVERYCSAATQQGNVCRVVGYDGAAHGFFNPPNAEGKWYRQTLAEAERFLTELGYLRPAQPSQIE
jgi:acetyl esterase/lipase